MPYPCKWHNLPIEWERAGAGGKSKPFLPEGYNWKNYGEMNIGFWQKHQRTPLAEAKKMLKDSNKNVMPIIDRYSDGQLFTKSFYKWADASGLGQYCVSATAVNMIGR